MLLPPDEGTLKAARKAWIETRVVWEQSEAFAFGPAGSLGYDGDLDDWPVNEVDVAAVLKDSKPITPELINSLQTTQKGFHTIELLLFGTNSNKVLPFSPRELEYLKYLTLAFDQTAQNLKQSWVAGVQGKPAYQTVFATAGESQNSAYPTQKAAVEEIVQGIMGCLDEVGKEKIGVPLTAKTTDKLESRFSYTSLEDFKNNIQGAENAYRGQITDSSSKGGESLSAWVAQQDPQLDQKIQQEFQAIQTALAALPKPIETQMTDPATLTQLKVSQDAILKVFETFEDQVLPLVKAKA
ncbi:MAG: peptidase M75 [Acaryochloridaceae cyanobacterium SU_2_1]|nr:peptidase M75 [Acaryochloridaceae cyanobacterium SU_2_1]